MQWHVFPLSEWFDVPSNVWVGGSLGAVCPCPSLVGLVQVGATPQHQRSPFPLRSHKYTKATIWRSPGQEHQHQIIDKTTSDAIPSSPHLQHQLKASLPRLTISIYRSTPSNSTCQVPSSFLMVPRYPGSPGEMDQAMRGARRSRQEPWPWPLEFDISTPLSTMKTKRRQR